MIVINDRNEVNRPYQMTSPLALIADTHPNDFIIYATYAAVKSLVMIGIAIIINYYYGRLFPLV